MVLRGCSGKALEKDFPETYLNGISFVFTG
jgi:hypothetical protein